MANILSVPVIMACAVVGTIAMLILVGAARWSFIYLIRYRLLKREVKNQHFAVSTKNDVLSIIIAIVALIAVAIMLIYGVPFVVKHISELPILELPQS